MACYSSEVVKPELLVACTFEFVASEPGQLPGPVPELQPEPASSFVVVVDW